MFFGEKLQSLRELNGLSRKELADELGVSEQAIWQYENQLTSPKMEVINTLKYMFNVKAKFFYTASTITNVALEEYIAYRADDRDSRKKTKTETIYIDFVHFFLNQLEGYLDLPLNKVLYLRNETLNMIHINNEHHIKQADRLKLIEEIAYHARQKLEIEHNRDLLFKLEIAGIYILEKNMGMDIDAYSLWTNNDRAYIVLGNKKKSAVRRNFDLAHELGHLLLHYKIDMNSLSNEEHRQIEKEAHHFASCFLLPEPSFINDFSLIVKKSNPDSYLDLKEKYLVSITALEYRAYQLKLLTFEENKYFYGSLSRKKYRQVEPLDLKIPIVKPGKIRSLFEILLENKLISINSFLEHHHLDIQFLCKLFDIEPAFFNAFTQSKTSYFDKNAVLPFTTKLSRLKS